MGLLSVGASPLAGLAAWNQQPLGQINGTRPPDPRQTWWQRMAANNGQGFTDAFNNPLLQAGMSLMGNARNGGDWSQVARDMQEQAQARLQRQAIDNEMRRQKAGDARDEEQFSWARDERAQNLDRRQRWSAALADPNLSPEMRQILEAAGPDGWAEALQGNRAYELQRGQLELQTEEMRNNNRYRDASLAIDRARLDQDRIANSANQLLGRGEAERINGDMARLDNWRMVDNDLARIREIYEQYPDVFQSLADGDQEQVVARYTRRGDPNRLAAVQELYAIGSNLAREELRGQTPVSNIDLLSALRANPNTSSSPEFVRRWLERAYEDRRNLEERVRSAVDYRQRFGTLYEPDPSTGSNWYQGQGYNQYQNDAAPTSPSSAPRQGDSDAQRELDRRLGGGGGNSSAAPDVQRSFGQASDGTRYLRAPTTILEQQAVSAYDRAVRSGNDREADVMRRRLQRAGILP